MALTFWFFNALNRDNYSTIIQYPLKVEYDHNQYVEVEKLPDKIAVNVKGGGWDLAKRYIINQKKEISVSLPEPEESRHLPKNLLLQSARAEINDFEITGIANDTFPIHLERKLEREIFVRVDSFKIPENKKWYITSEIAYNPETVRAAGPVSHIEKLPDTLTINKNFKINTGKSQEEVALPQYQHVSFTPSKITVAYEIGQLKSMKLKINLDSESFENNNIILSDSVIEIFYDVPDHIAGKYNEDFWRANLSFNRSENPEDKITVSVNEIPGPVRGLRIKPDQLNYRYAR